MTSAASRKLEGQHEGQERNGAGATTVGNKVRVQARSAITPCVPLVDGDNQSIQPCALIIRSEQLLTALLLLYVIIKSLATLIIVALRHFDSSSPVSLQ